VRKNKKEKCRLFYRIGIKGKYKTICIAQFNVLSCELKDSSNNYNDDRSTSKVFQSILFFHGSSASGR